MFSSAVAVQCMGEAWMEMSWLLLDSPVNESYWWPEEDEAGHEDLSIVFTRAADIMRGNNRLLSNAAKLQY